MMGLLIAQLAILILSVLFVGHRIDNALRDIARAIRERGRLGL